MYFILNKEHLTFHLQYKRSGTFATVNILKVNVPQRRQSALRVRRKGITVPFADQRYMCELQAKYATSPKCVDWRSA